MAKPTLGGLTIHGSLRARCDGSESVLFVADGGLLVIGRDGGNIVVNPRTDTTRLSVTAKGITPHWLLFGGGAFGGLLSGLLTWFFRQNHIGDAKATLELGERGTWELEGSPEIVKLLAKILTDLSPKGVGPRPVTEAQAGERPSEYPDAIVPKSTAAAAVRREPSARHAGYRAIWPFMLAATMLAAGLLQMPLGYYSILRLTVIGASLYGVASGIRSNWLPRAFVFGLPACLWALVWGPGREFWSPLDLLGCFGFLLAAGGYRAGDWQRDRLRNSGVPTTRDWGIIVTGGLVLIGVLVVITWRSLVVPHQQTSTTPSADVQTARSAAQTVSRVGSIAPTAGASTLPSAQPALLTFKGVGIELRAPRDDSAASVCIATESISGRGPSCYSPAPIASLPWSHWPKVSIQTLKPRFDVILFEVSAFGGGSGSLRSISLLTLVDRASSSAQQPQHRDGHTLSPLIDFRLDGDQSEYRLWDLPEISDMPVLVTANFLWRDDDGGHFAAHRYTITAYTYHPSLPDDGNALVGDRGSYELQDGFVTVTKYPGLDSADSVKVLEHERTVILARLKAQH